KRPFPAGWKPDYGARVGVMPRDGGNADVRWFDVELCYVFHPLNAYDADGRVVLDVARHPKMFDTDIYGPAELPPTLDRWTIDLDAGKVIEERLDDRAQEFPRVDERVVGRPHRFGYTAHFGVDEHEIQFGGLLKHDLRTGAVETRTFGSGSHAGEAVFVPASPTAGEDEGWVLSIVYDDSRKASDLVILDAQEFEEVARVHLPQRVPFGFHGWWLPDGAA
ncbi:MAG TPA: carotenoid oxygenase family protein, partial [Acidimicrobiia bacterium]